MKVFFRTSLAATAALAVLALTPNFATADVSTQARRGPTAEQRERAKDLPGTTVIRIDRASGQMEVAHVQARLGKHPMNSFRGLEEVTFTPVDLTQPVAGEMGQRGLGWLFSFLGGSWNYPSYNYYGYDYNYNNYYSYPYSNSYSNSTWDYYYFGWPNW